MNILKKIFLSDNIMLALVIANAGIMYVGGFLPDTKWISFLDYLFTVLFVIEAIVKIKELSWKEYWHSGWNKFDFIITIIALPSLINIFADLNISTNIFLVFRALRTFKSFRLFQFVPHIESLLNGVKLACKASFVVAVGMIVLLLVFSILTTTIFGSIAPKYFGDPASATYSLFRLFTIEGWYDIPDTIAANSSVAMGVFAKIYFSLLLFCGGIIGMSLVNSIFVDAMAQDNNDEVLDKLDKIEQLIKTTIVTGLDKKL